MTLLFKYFWLIAIGVNFLNGWWLIRKGAKMSASLGVDAAGFRKYGWGYAIITSIPWLVMGIGIQNRPRAGASRHSQHNQYCA